VSVEGSQVNGNVLFNNVTTIVQQARDESGQEPSDELVKMLHKAQNLIQVKDYSAAILVLESALKKAQLASILNNLGAAHLAVGDIARAEKYFGDALAIDAEDDVAEQNMELVGRSAIGINENDQVGQGLRNTEQEPNNTVFEATPINYTHDTIGEISDDKDTDYFKFRLSGELRDKVTIRLESNSPSLRPHLTVYDSNKSEIETVYSGTPGASTSHTISVNPQSDYFFRVSHYDSSGQYTLITTAHKAFDDNEPNDDQFSSTRITVGQTTTANIMDVSDDDWYQLSGIISEQVTVKMESRSASLRPHVGVFDQNKVQILEQYRGTYGADLEFIFKAKPGANYYLRVSPYSSYGDYRLSVK